MFFFFFSKTSAAINSDESGKNFMKNEAVKGELGKKIDKYLAQITPFGFSGVLLVAKKGEIILNKGYGMAIRSNHIPKRKKRSDRWYRNC